MSTNRTHVSITAVTLEGTIIHKSGLITGGRSTHNTGKKWDEKDVQGMKIHKFVQPPFIFMPVLSCLLFIGLMRVRDALLAQLADLNKQKPRGKSDENLIAEVARLDSAITIAKDDLVRCFLL